jgi:ADP-heptose:LPS heptosyltransferase
MTPRLVMLRALGIGDLLSAVPAMRALARAHPRHRRLLAAPAWLAPLAMRSGAIHAVIDTAALAPLPAAAQNADLAVNLHGRGPESHRLLAASGARRIIAFANPDVAWSRFLPRWREDEHERERWCRLLREHDIDADPDDLDLPAPRCRFGIARGATVVHPGAASAARRWPVERFAAIARAEREAGRTVVVTGNAADAFRACAIAAAAGLPEEAVLAGRTDLEGLAGVIAAAGRVVCGDTGVAHLATAFGTPSVVLFGPVSPKLWGPPARRPQHRVIWVGRPGDPHGGVLDDGLAAIEPAAVLKALADL